MPALNSVPRGPSDRPPCRVLTGFLPLGLSPDNDVQNVRGPLPFPVCPMEESGVQGPRPGPAR